MGLQLADIGDFVEDVFAGAGDNFAGQGANAKATAEYNTAVATLVLNKAKNDSKKTEAATKLANTVVVGLLVILAVFVLAKYVIPAVR